MSKTFKNKHRKSKLRKTYKGGVNWSTNKGIQENHARRNANAASATPAQSNSVEAPAKPNLKIKIPPNNVRNFTPPPLPPPPQPSQETLKREERMLKLFPRSLIDKYKPEKKPKNKRN